MTFITHSHLASRLGQSGDVPPFALLCVVMELYKEKFNYDAY
jgi:hypothetical protein